jgi:hypothetical protein
LERETLEEFAKQNEAILNFNIPPEDSTIASTHEKIKKSNEEAKNGHEQAMKLKDLFIRRMNSECLNAIVNQNYYSSINKHKGIN